MSAQFSQYDPNSLNFGQGNWDWGQYPNPLNMNGPTSPYYTPLNINPADQAMANSMQWGGGTPVGGIMPGSSNGPAAPTYNNAYSQFWGENGQAIGSTLGAVSSLFNLYSGIKQLSLMNKNFKLAKKSTRMNYDASAKSYNNTVETRQAAEDQAYAAGVGRAPTANYEKIPLWGG